MGEVRELHVPVKVVSATEPGSTVRIPVYPDGATAKVAELPVAKCPGCEQVYAAERVDYVWKGHRGKRVCVKCWATAFISEAVASVVAAVEYDRWIAEADEE